jgi:hypothetical protein
MLIIPGFITPIGDNALTAWIQALEYPHGADI